MLSSTVPRTIFRSLPRQTPLRPPLQQLMKLPSSRPLINRPTFTPPLRPSFSSLSQPIGLRPSKTLPPTPRFAVLFSTSSARLVITPKNIPDKQHEKELQQEKLHRKPADEVTTISTTTPMFERTAPNAPEKNMRKELDEELKTVRETFSMKDVPKDLTFMGLAGLVPYVGTSATSLFLAWDLTHAQPYLVSAETAHNLLAVVEPIQLGYGAVLLSFLGAVHWGLEFAGYGGRFGRKRYAIGILAPLLSWPTTFFLSYDTALATQFLGFTGMYFADALATKWGWAPHWYTNYRFLLTFVVGTCIVTTLIARSKIGDRRSTHATLEENSYYNHLQNIQAFELRKEEREIADREAREAAEKEEAERKAKEEAEKAKKEKKEGGKKGEKKEGGKKGETKDGKKEDGKKEEDAKKKDQKEGDNDRSKERATKGAVKQAEKASQPKESSTEGTEKRRKEDAEESDEDKEQKGPKKTGKTVAEAGKDKERNKKEDNKEEK